LLKKQLIAGPDTQRLADAERHGDLSFAGDSSLISHSGRLIPYFTIDLLRRGKTRSFSSKAPQIWQNLPVRFSSTGTLATALAIGLAVALWAPWRTPSLPLRQSAIAPGAETTTDDDALNYGPSTVLSSDGSRLAFLGRDSQICVRRLDEQKAACLAGTEGARDPFFSPDGQWIAFFTATQLKKVPVAGGAVVALADVEQDRGGAWTESGAIYFTTFRGPIQSITATGGKPQPLTHLDLDDREVTQRWPQTLDHDRMVLYTAHTAGSGFEEAFGVLVNLRTGRRKVVHRGGFHYRYLPSGHIVYISLAGLYALPFDLARMRSELELNAQPSKILDNVANQPHTGGAQISFTESPSSHGEFLYAPAEPLGTSVISWMDRHGQTQPLLGRPGHYYGLSLSPDGTRVAFGLSDGRQSSIGIYDPKLDAPPQMTPMSGATAPIWTPDGQRVTYTMANNIFWQRADGAGVAQALTRSLNVQVPESWHPSGKILAFREFTGTNRNDIEILYLQGDEASGWKVKDSKTYLATDADEFGAAFSPDGRWLAYCSNGSGTYQVYVRPFPGPGDPWPVSRQGGTLPVWSHPQSAHGSRILYRALDGQIMSAAWAVHDGFFETDTAVAWTTGVPQDMGQVRGFDLHPDGQRLAVIALAPGQTEHRLVLAENFFDELRRRTRH
jgi:serine/threonine-protein kinase